MSLVYQCDFCMRTAEPEHGNQRDPGPYAPKGWRTLSGYPTKSICDKCLEKLTK